AFMPPALREETSGASVAPSRVAPSGSTRTRAAVSASAFRSLHLGGDGRHDGMDVADHGVGGPTEDRWLRVRVDDEDPLGRLGADDVLDRPADPAFDVEIRCDARPGLADLLCMG